MNNLDKLTNKLAIENSELQHELHFARQLLVGKDKTIAHLKAKHPHQWTSITQTEEQITELRQQPR